jgi:hypothetical protein
MYQNFMDYSDDKCMVMFTNDQKARMQACLQNCVNRLTLTTSTVCSNFVNTQEQSSINGSWNVYPNPVLNDLEIDVEGIHESLFTIFITNTLGQTIKTLNNSYGQKHFKLNLSNQPKGIYNVTLNCSQGLFSKRIVLE